MAGGEEVAFATSLKRRGLDSYVVPVERKDWLSVASAVLTLDFWRGTCRPDGPAYSWYLKKVQYARVIQRKSGSTANVILMFAFVYRLLAGLPE